jgi:hypothetical protein
LLGSTSVLDLGFSTFVQNNVNAIDTAQLVTSATTPSLLKPTLPRTKEMQLRTPSSKLIDCSGNVGVRHREEVGSRVWKKDQGEAYCRDV